MKSVDIRVIDMLFYFLGRCYVKFSFHFCIYEIDFEHMVEVMFFFFVIVKEINIFFYMRDNEFRYAFMHLTFKNLTSCLNR